MRPVISPSVKWKKIDLLDEFYQIDPRLQFILEDCARWVVASGYDFVVTALLSDAETDARLGRVSKSHQEGRAADVRCVGWPEEFIAKFIKFAEAAHGKDGAISAHDGQRRLVVFHNVGHGPHLHIQVSRRTK